MYIQYISHTVISMQCTYVQCLVRSWCIHISTISTLLCVPQVPLFQNTEIGFTKLLALSIKPVLFLKNEYIVRKGDIGSEVGLEPWDS